MRRERKGFRLLALIIAAAVTLTACSFGAPGGKDGKSESGLLVYYLNREGDGLVTVSEPAPDGSVADQVDHLIAAMQTVPKEADYQVLLPDDVTLQKSEVSGGLLTLDFSKGYEKLSSTREVLARAGVVRTMVQLDSIDGVQFTVDGADAKAADGKTLGVMNADTFVEDSGKMINAITHTSIDLFFASKDGETLNRESRSIYYSASKPLEWAIVERIIAGPKVEGNDPTVPSNLQIISVTSSNGICYVNLNDTFISSPLSVDEKIPIYSIVDSICENCRDIHEVQFAIDGDSNLTFRQTMKLGKPFKPDMSLVNDSIESTD